MQTVGVVIASLVAVGLLLRERSHWRAVAVQLAPERLADVRPTWPMVTCIVVAFVLCGVAIELDTRESTVRGDRGALVLLVDVSRSMYAADTPPNRLERAKDVLTEALTPASGWRVGVVAFAGDASLICPLTLDHDAVRTAVHSLSEDNVSVSGTAIGEGIAEALEALNDSRDGAVLLVSDGENLEGSAEASLSRARSVGVPVHVLAVGTVEGATVPHRRRESQQLRESAAAPISRLDAALLRRLANETGGRYISVDEARSVFADLERHRSAGSVTEPLWGGRIYLALLALALLSAEMFLRSDRS